MRNVPQLRVLHVIGKMDRGGAETLLMNLYRSIDRSKVQFDFLVHSPEKGDYDDEIENLGGVVHHLVPFTASNLPRYRSACRSFFREHQGQYPIVHGHIGSCAAIYLSEAKRFGSICIAHSHAQKNPLSPAELVFRMLSYPTRNVADYFFACSEQAGIDRYGKAVVASDKFRVLNNGIDVARYACTDAEHDAAKRAAGYDGNVVIGHVGRLTEIKNHRFLIDTFCEFKATHPNALLFLVGRGPLEEQLKKYAAERGISDSVMFFGVRPNVEDYLKLFDAFVFPSVREGLGMSVVEAQAAGLPCVVSTGVPKTALVTPFARRIPLDEGAKRWAAEIGDALENRLSREECPQYVLDAGYDINEVAKDLTDCYFGLLKK